MSWSTINPPEGFDPINTGEWFGGGLRPPDTIIEETWEDLIEGAFAGGGGGGSVPTPVPAPPPEPTAPPTEKMAYLRQALIGRKDPAPFTSGDIFFELRMQALFQGRPDPLRFAHAGAESLFQQAFAGNTNPSPFQGQTDLRWRAVFERWNRPAGQLGSKGT